MRLFLLLFVLFALAMPMAAFAQSGGSMNSFGPQASVGHISERERGSYVTSPNVERWPDGERVSHYPPYHYDSK